MATIGELLRLARQRRGFTQKDAAHEIGILQPVLSRMENGLTEPDSAVVSRAAIAYGFPEDFFKTPDPVYGPPVSVHPMTRSKSDLTSAQLDMITAELNIRLMHLSRFLDTVEFTPTSSIPSLDVEQYGSPEKIAATVRAHWGLQAGPVQNLVRWVERAGVVVAFSNFDGASVSGVTFRVAGRTPLILLNVTHPADRLRFTLAHELGHLVMHQFPTDKMEVEATEFASALLMPAADIRQAFQGRQITLALLASLKPEWQVAMQALLMRATFLNFVSPNQSRYLWQQISARGWRLKEPPDLEFPIERPTVLASIVGSFINDFGYSLPELAKLTRINELEFTKMYGNPADSCPSPTRPKLRLVI